MRTKLLTDPNWWEDAKLFETMKQVIAQVGQLADERPEGPLVGYMAERPETLRNCIRVWAPCGCCVTYMSQTVSVLTECALESCNFEWSEAQRAIEALKVAEDETPSTLAIIKKEPVNG
jgi:hypothetical protein